MLKVFLCMVLNVASPNFSELRLSRTKGSLTEQSSSRGWSIDLEHKSGFSRLRIVYDGHKLLCSDHLTEKSSWDKS